MKNLTAVTGWLLLIAGMGAYLYGICKAIWPVYLPGKTEPFYPEMLETITTSIGAILLTNLGAVLGISVTRPNTVMARIRLSPAAIAVPEPASQREKIQIAAVLIYVISLIACSVHWALSTFRATPVAVVSLIPQYGKTLIGVISAYFALVLAVNPKP